MTEQATIQFGPLAIDATAYGSQGNAVLGIKDSGKTYTASLLAERLYAAGIPFVAFDPIGMWRWLRAPGAGSGIPVVVAGGVAGDLVLTPATAPAIVEAALQHGISLVLDLFSLELSKGDWRRIVRECTRLLLHRNAEFGLRHIFIEEAEEFVPQVLRRGEGEDVASTYVEVEKLTRMGGNARLGYTLINPRAEGVNKQVLELCENLFLHRQRGKNSLTALGKWLDVGNVAESKVIMSTLSTLPTGECWAWLGGADAPRRVQVPRKNSFHPNRRLMRGATEVGSPAAAIDASVFVAVMRDSLREIAEDAQANDPQTLRAEIARLKTVLAQPAIDPQAVECARTEGYTAGRADERRDVHATIAGWITAARELAERMSRLSPSAQTAEMEPPPANPNASASPHRAKQTPRLLGPENEVSESLGGSARRLLTVLKRHAPAHLTWQQTATLAGLAARGGSFNTACAQLRRAGMIVEENGKVISGPRGMAWNDAVAIEPLPMTAEGVVEMWCQKLPKPASEMLRCMAAHQVPVTAPQLAAALGKQPRGGSWNTGIASLRRNHLIDIRDGQISLSPFLRDA